MSFMQRSSRWLDHVEEAFIAIALAVMTLLTFVQVILRYLFHTGIVWSLEATTYSFAWLVVVGMAYGVRTHAHIASDLLMRSIRGPAQALVAVVALVLCLVYCALMAYGSASFVAGLYALGHDAQDIAVPRWLLATVMPVGFGLLALRLLQAGWRYFVPRPESQTEVDAV